MGFLKDSAGSLAGGAISALGGLASSALSNHAASNLNLLNYKQAKEFAQNQIQWKVADAKKAGLHPLAALGMSPVMAPTATAIGDYSGLDRGLTDMGQNLSRSIDSYMTASQRRAEEEKAAALEEERLQMQREEHKARMSESMANVMLKQAEANRILNPIDKVELVNRVKSSSWRFGAQPRSPAKPRIKSGREKLSSMEKMGQSDKYVRPVSEDNDNLMSWMRGPDGEYVLVPSKTTAEVGQNLYGLLEAYGYGRYGWRRGREWINKHIYKDGRFY